MKVRVDQLAQQLNKSLAPIYILSGDEVLLCQEAADQIRKAAQNHQIDERLRFVADAQFDWEEVINENQSLSLFSNRRLFDIQIDKKNILLAESIKTLGEVVVPIKVGYQMTSEITVTIVPLETDE